MAQTTRVASTTGGARRRHCPRLPRLTFSARRSRRRTRLEGIKGVRSMEENGTTEYRLDWRWREGEVTEEGKRLSLRLYQQKTVELRDGVAKTAALQDVSQT